MTFTIDNVRKFMRSITDDHRDPVTDELNATTLAEHAADHFDMADEPGPLDDPDHWIWEAAVDVCSEDDERRFDCCPGCGCEPGEGRTPGCVDAMGCGFTY